MRYWGLTRTAHRVPIHEPGRPPATGVTIKLCKATENGGEWIAGSQRGGRSRRRSCKEKRRISQYRPDLMGNGVNNMKGAGPGGDRL